MTALEANDLDELADPTEHEAGALGRNVKKGLGWSVGGTLFSKLGGFALGIVLARLLAPEDFGLYAVALAATQIVMMIKDLGLEAATQHWRGPIDEMVPTASTISVAFSATVYLIFFFGAPAFAELAGNPDAAPVLRMLTAVILIYGFNAVPTGVLLRGFRQARLVTANFAGLAVNAAVAVGLAVAGAGAMSFAVGQVAGTLATGILVYIASGLHLRFGFDRGIAARLLTFGVPLAGGLALEAVLLNVDFVVIGRLLGATSLGYYLLAFNISSWALTSLTASIRYVAVAGFSRLSEMDVGTMNAGVQRSMKSLFMLVAPIGALTAALATPMVTALYGEEWSPAAEALRFLAILTVVRVLISLAHDLFMGLGSTRSMVLINGAWTIALIPVMVVAVHVGGINGAGAAHAVVALGVAAPLTIFALRRVGIRLGPIVPGLLRPTLASGLAVIAALAVDRSLHAPPIVRLAFAGVAGLVVYIATAIAPNDLRRFAHAVSARLRLRSRAVSAPNSAVHAQ
jgi:O-antigen/teichoic acid export membrane protein